jgi:aspartyl-tRNA(Asn)/glutamyl-tRNA(Gln) amidotransferase subunit A
MALSWSLDKIGPMGRSADCCGLVLKAIAGGDPLDETSVERPFEHPDKVAASSKKMRVGVLKGAFDGVQTTVKDNFERAVEVLRKVVNVDPKEIPLPDLPFDAAMETVVFVEAAAAFEDLIETGRVSELRDINSRSAGFVGTMIPGVDYVRAMRLRMRMKRELHATYAGYDALICPSLPTVAPALERVFEDWAVLCTNPTNTIIAANNFVGQPGLAVPTGFGENGLPTGLTFSGQPWSEPALLALGRLYQRATDWHLKRPPP